MYHALIYARFHPHRLTLHSKYPFYQKVCATAFSVRETLKVMLSYLNRPGGEWLKEVGFVWIIHHGQVHPGFLQPSLEAVHFL